MPSLTWGIFETIFATSYNNSKRYLTLSPRWTGHNTDLPSDSNISKAVRVNIAFAEDFCKEYSSFLMVCRLIDFALVVLMLLMFKACVIIGISKIEFFNFSGTERVKQNKKNLKTNQNLLSLEVNYFSSNFNNSTNSQYVFGFLLKLYPFRSLCLAGRVTIPTYLRTVISRKR